MTTPPEETVKLDTPAFSATLPLEETERVAVSSLVMVPVPEDVTRLTLLSADGVTCGLESCRVKVSSPSTAVSGSTVTSTVLLVSPGAKVKVDVEIP